MFYFSRSNVGVIFYLLAVVGLSACGSSGETQDADNTPDIFTLEAQFDVALDTQVTSDNITISGIDSPATISIEGGLYSINGDEFSSQVSSVENGDTVTVQLTSAASFETSTSLEVTIGDVSGTFEVTTESADISPLAFNFTAQTSAPLNSNIASSTIVVSDINTVAPISISNGQYSINGGGFTSLSGVVNNGDTVQIQLTSSNVISTKISATLTIGDVSSSFGVTTMLADISPIAFNFTAQTSVPLNSNFTSNSIVVSDINTLAPISISNGQYSINGGDFTSLSGEVNNGDSVQIQLLSSPTFSTQTLATLSIGNVSGSFEVTTLLADVLPLAFTFDAQANVARGARILSNTITVSGINTATTISVSGGEYSVNSGAFQSDASVVSAGDLVQVSVVSSDVFLSKTSAVLSIGDITSAFEVTTIEADVSPAEFSFTDQANVSLETIVVSSTVKITDINTQVPIGITSGEYSINGGGFTSDVGTVSEGDTVRVRLTSSGEFETSTSAILTIGNIRESFGVSTLVADATPSIFEFIAQTGIEVSTLVTSNPLTIGGINTDASISITDGEYAINGGAYTANDGLVSEGDTVQVQLTSSDEVETLSRATLTIGGIRDSFEVTTEDADITPAAFTFTTQNGVELSSNIVSNSITVSEINTSATIIVTDGEYSINGGAFTSEEGVVSTGDTVQVRVVSSADFDTQTSMSLIIGDVRESFGVTTFVIDTTPVDFAFIAQTEVNVNTSITSAPIVVAGINTETAISIIGGEFLVNGGEATNQEGTVVDGDGVQILITSSNEYETQSSATLTIGGVSATFDVTTRSFQPYITTWKTDNEGASEDTQITLTLNPELTYDFNVDWGDGSTDENITENITHEYSVVGVYQISISGDYPAPYFIQSTDSAATDSLKLISVDQWGDQVFQSMYQAFYNADNLLIEDTESPDLSQVSSMVKIFRAADDFNSDISNWNTINVVDMSQAFRGAVSFNQDIGSWDLGQVIATRRMFYGAESFNQNIGAWNVVNVLSMEEMFLEATTFNQDIGEWDVSSVLDMSSMFSGAESFNQDVGAWNVSSVLSMKEMFLEATTFNQYIGDWEVFDVDNMSSMFSGAESFNQDIGAWGVSNVLSMEEMFSGAESFNQDIGDWQVSNVEDMSSMFFGATSFDQDISGWVVETVTDMSLMFSDAISFNQDLSAWNVSNVADMTNMFSNTSVSIDNYNALLNGWATLALQSSVSFDAGASRYTSDASAARDTLTGTFNWDITDGGLVLGEPPALTVSGNTLLYTGIDSEIVMDNSGGVPNSCTSDNLPDGMSVQINNLGTSCEIIGAAVNAQNLTGATISAANEFGESDVIVNIEIVESTAYITRWKTDNEGESEDNQVTIITRSVLDYNYNVDWGDGNIDEDVTTDIVHTYDAAGEYEVSITGTFPAPFFPATTDTTSTDSLKLLAIVQWGIRPWDSMSQA
ncbi:MAG: BspA family leucine-rich repeat surface protein, partial [Paraglaciecola sp.]|uniref:BspA family leucine-rich repeat surface protein n=1 Tax=Paraglaciecola sp. TaxID=1920173 RepID=UPI0032975C76